MRTFDKHNSLGKYWLVASMFLDDPREQQFGAQSDAIEHARIASLCHPLSVIVVRDQAYKLVCIFINGEQFEPVRSLP